MFKKAVFPGIFLQGVGVLSELAALVESMGSQAPSPSRPVTPPLALG